MSARHRLAPLPPARKRLRAYDPAKIRAAVLAQFGHVRAAVRTLGPEQLDLPTRLGDWTVRELAAHVTTTVEAVGRNLEEDEPAVADAALPDRPFSTAARATDLAEDTRALARATPDLDALYTRTADRLTERLTERLADAPGTRPPRARTGALTSADPLVTRTVDLVVHTDDLNAAVPGLAIPYDRQALAACTRLLADALAAKAPGGAVEVRIPPYAVVQCAEGPRHTRGTPPNVVETAPLTWIRLATGRLTWSDALAAADVSASGERADLSGFLPLMG